VFLERAFDREVDGSSRTIYVRATSEDGSTAIRSLNLTIEDVNEFVVTAPLDIDVLANNVTENAVDGTTVGIVARASDADATTNTVTYSLVDEVGEAYDGGEFTIGSSSGIVTVAGSIDREEGSTRTLYVKATSSDGSSAINSFVVNVADVDEFDVMAPTDVDVALNTVVENAAVGTVVGVTARAVDGDASNNTVTYSLVASALGGTYTAGEFAVNAGTGVVTVAGSLDYEAGDSRTVHVKATSSDGSSAINSFVVNVADVDEFDVTEPADADTSANTVTENAAVGTVVGVTALASDGDASNNTVTYSLVDELGEAYEGGEFTIGSSSGIVTVAGGIDYEAGESRTIYVKATSSDGSSAINSFVVNVADVDEFDVTEPADADTSANTVTENAAVGTVVGVTALASDGDASNNTVTYSLVDELGEAYDGGEFTIGSSSGIVTVAGGIDYEAGSNRTVYVKATSSDGSSQTSSFVVNVTNLNDNVPLFTSGGTGSVNENASINKVIYTANAPDADNLAAVTYSVTGGDAGMLKINPKTGVVTLLASADFETKPTYSFDVVASDGVNNTTQAVVVSVVNLNDNAPVFTSGDVGEVT